MPAFLPTLWHRIGHGGSAAVVYAINIKFFDVDGVLGSQAVMA